MGRLVGFLCVSFLVAVILALLLLNGSKIAFGIIVLIFLAFILGGLIFKTGIKEIDKFILYFIVVSIPFPYIVQFLGKDAVTLTTVAICSLSIITVLRHLIERKSLSFRPRFAFILPILILGSFTMSLILNPYFLGQSIRYYVANVSGILLYFIVLATAKKDSDVVMLIKVILFALVLESVIVFLVWRFPFVTKLLAPFTPRTISLENPVVEGVSRSVGTVWGYELLAEWFLVGSILSVGLFYRFKKNIYIFSLFCCLAGIVFTATRSAFLLLIFGLAIIFILLKVLKKYKKWITIKIISLFFLSGIILLVFFHEQAGAFIKRLGDYFQQSDLFSSEAINRKYVWKSALYFIKEPTIFGKGLYNVRSFSYWLVFFHSLYLTILYKFGILGLIIHSIFWIKMLHASWRILIAKDKGDNWYTLFFLFIAVILILIDGIKIEYLRYGHTIQFVWLIYSLLIVSIKQSREKDEDIVVSPASI